MRKLTLTTLLAVTVTGAYAAASAAPVTDNEWRVLANHDDGAPAAIISGSDSEPGVLLSCKGDKLETGLSLEAGDISAVISKSTNRIKRRGADIQIGDRDPITEDWAYVPAKKIAKARSSVMAKRIYNAAVTDAPIAFTLDRKDQVTYDLPAINDTFKAFASRCPVTNGS